MSSPPDPRPPPNALIAGMYFAHFAASGAWVPYLAPWLLSRGFDAPSVGTVLAAMAAVRVVSGPLWGIAADASRRTASLLTFAAGLGAVSGALALLAGRPAWITAFLLLGALSRASISSLIDAIAIRSLERRGTPDRYGRVRVWGSAGFLVFGGLSGWMGEKSAAVPLAVALLFLATGAALSRALPDEPPVRVTGFTAALSVIARSPRMVALWAAAVLHGIALSSYDSFYAVHIGALHLPSRWAGAGLVVGVGSEMALFTVFSGQLRRAEPLTWVALGCGLGAVRWAITAALADPVLLTCLAALHALTFGAWWLGMIESLRRDLPEEVRASAQSMLVATAYGVGPMACGLIASRVSGTIALYGWSAACSAVAAGLVLVASRLPRPARHRAG